MSIRTRGKVHPHDDQRVHLMEKWVDRGVPMEDVTCRNGSFHLRHTDKLNEVTCDKCLAKLPKT